MLTFKSISNQCKKLNRKKYIFVDVLFFSITTLLVFVFEISYRTDSRIENDIVNYVLPAFAMDHNLGSPYSDYYINRPPGAFILIRLWAKMFGYELQSWIILESLLLLVISLILYDIFNCLGPKLISAISVIFSLLTLLFSGTLAMFMPLEIISLFLILLATRILLKNRSSFKKTTVFFTLLFFAASVREQYLVTLIFMFVSVLIAQKNEKKLFKTTQACLLGLIIAGSAFYWHFLVHSNFADFVSVFKDEFDSEKQPLSHYFGWILDAISFHSVTSFSSLILKPELHMYIFIPVFFCLLISALVHLSNPMFFSHTFQQFIVGMVGFSLIASVSWQSSGFRFSAHYAISSLIGMFLCIISTISFIIRFLSFKFDLSKRWVYIPTALLLFFVPSVETVKLVAVTFDKISASTIANQFSRITSNQLSLNEIKAAEIIKLSPPDFNCSVNIYGWGSGSFYLNSKSKPCTKYFLPNLVASKQMAIDYMRDIERNPPRVINYGCFDYLTCSDLDINEFETIVFPYAKVIADCYFFIAQEQHQSTDTNYYKLFLSRWSSKTEQSNCIKTTIGSSN